MNLVKIKTNSIILNDKKSILNGVNVLTTICYFLADSIF